MDCIVELFISIQSLFRTASDYMCALCFPVATSLFSKYSTTPFSQLKVTRNKTTHDFLFSGKKNIAKICEQLILVEGPNEIQVFNFLARKASINCRQQSHRKENELFFFQHVNTGVVFARDQAEDVFKEWLHFDGCNIIVFAPNENNIVAAVTSFRDEFVRRRGLGSVVSAAVIVYPETSFEQHTGKSDRNVQVETDNNCLFVSMSMNYLKSSTPESIYQLVGKYQMENQINLMEKKGQSFASQLKYGVKKVFEAAASDSKIQVQSFDKHNRSMDFALSAPQNVKYNFRQNILLERTIKEQREKFGIIDPKQIIALESFKIETKRELIFSTILPLGFTNDRKQIKIENSAQSFQIGNENYFRVTVLLERKQSVDSICGKIVAKYNNDSCAYDYSSMAKFYQFYYYIPVNIDYTDYTTIFEQKDEIMKLMIVYEKASKPAQQNKSSLVEVEDDGEQVDF